MSQSYIHRHIKRFTKGRHLTRKLNDESVMTAFARNENPAHKLKFMNKIQRQMYVLKLTIAHRQEVESRLAVSDCQAVEGVILSKEAGRNPEQLGQTT